MLFIDTERKGQSGMDWSWLTNTDVWSKGRTIVVDKIPSEEAGKTDTDVWSKGRTIVVDKISKSTTSISTTSKSTKVNTLEFRKLE